MEQLEQRKHQIRYNLRQRRGKFRDRIIRQAEGISDGGGKEEKEGGKEGEMDSTVSDRSQLRAGQFGGVGWAGKEGEEPESSEATGGTNIMHTLSNGVVGMAGYGVYILPGTTVRYGNGLGEA